MSSREKEPQQDSPLFRLPFELRIMIYECLSNMTTYKLNTDGTNQSRSPWIIERSISPLRQVCQQLRSETRDFQFRRPTMLDLRAKCTQSDILWLMRTGRFATITNISVHSANFDTNFCQNIYLAAWEMMWPAWWSFRYDKDSDEEWATDEDASEDGMDIDSDSDASNSDSDSEDPDPFPAWKRSWLRNYFSNIQVLRFCDLPKATSAAKRFEADAKALLHNPSLTFNYINVPEVKTLRPGLWGAAANLDLQEALRFDDGDEEEAGAEGDRGFRLAGDEAPFRSECIVQ
ncbi:hypothetical protein E8E13_009479 [Curvularia kusanoi]|uniref:F-box domain-containing protein n=1 Tax=Curvularia kusanoi TaxID=90978 RepID=A0A9P4TD23_CURKU|nr:hypothetical protein E8E13_009479 [Curvularia kusanoi]